MDPCIAKPPAPHTEASLLNAMEHAGKIIDEETLEDHEEEYGIGTPATRADTIEKLLKKQMATRKGRALIPTEYGIRLIEILLLLGSRWIMRSSLRSSTAIR